MTNAELQALKDLYEKTTKDTWHVELDDLTEEQNIMPTGLSCYGKGAANCYADSDFVAAIHAAFPGLIEMVEKMKDCDNCANFEYGIGDDPCKTCRKVKRNGKHVLPEWEWDGGA